MCGSKNVGGVTTVGVFRAPDAFTVFKQTDVANEERRNMLRCDGMNNYSLWRDDVRSVKLIVGAMFEFVEEGGSVPHLRSWNMEHLGYDNTESCIFCISYTVSDHISFISVTVQ